MTDLDRLGALFQAQQDEALEAALAEVDPRTALPRLEGPEASLGAWLLLARRGGPWAFDAGLSAADDAPAPWLGLVRDAGAACAAPVHLGALQAHLEAWRERSPSAGEVAWCLGALAAAGGRDRLVDLILDPAESPLARVTAVAALRHGALDDTERQALVHAIREPDAGSAHVLRREACLTLGHHGAAEVGPDLIVAATDPDPAVARTAWWALERCDASATRRLAFVSAHADDLAQALVERVPQVHSAAPDAEKPAWLALASRARVQGLVPWARLQQPHAALSGSAAALLLRTAGEPDALADTLRGWCAGGPEALPCLEAVGEVLPQLPREWVHRALVEVGLDVGGPLGEARLLEVASWLEPANTFEQARTLQQGASPDVARELSRLLLRAPARG